MNTEELKKQQELEVQELAEENKKKIEEIVPKFDSELKVLCEKHGVMIQGFCMRSDIGCQAGIRIALKKPPTPYDVK